MNIHCKCKWSDTFLRCCNHKRFYCVLLFVLLVNIHCKGKWTISEGRTLTKVTLSTGKNAWRDAFWEKGALEYPSTSHNINVNMRHGVWRDYRNCAVTLVRCPRSPLAISDSRNEVTFTAHNGPLWDSGGDSGHLCNQHNWQKTTPFDDKNHCTLRAVGAEYRKTCWKYLFRPV